jgi:hypothetical protein
MPKHPKRPRDPNQLAKMLVDIASGEVVEADQVTGKSPSAVAAGRLGGLKGGKARAVTLTKERRVSIAKKAAKKRWAKEPS